MTTAGRVVVFLLSMGMTAVPTVAQGKADLSAGDSEPARAQAVFLSDLHLDPFHDPAKVPQLVKAKAEDWQAILSAPDSPTQVADFAGVQSACKGKAATDSPFALFRSSLDAAKAQAPEARFVAVSGDLLVHDLDCRYRAALHLPASSSDDQSISAGFAEKTTVFVIREVEAAFAGLPVYMALGNNDSRCKHDRMDVHDGYLVATAAAVVDGLVGVSAAERKQALNTYQSEGYYAVTMAAPMEHTRLLVLDDIYMMAKFANCEANDKDQKGAQEQMAWLNKELDAARKAGEPVWVLGHVPPAVNPKNAVTGVLTFCISGKADPYLASDDLANALVSHADVVRLGVFGHTHMDEIHLLGSGEAGVPIKVVGSVSPVTGNLPSFTVAKIAPATATMTDYTVFEASNKTGVGTTWTREYGFDEQYGETTFTAASLSDLIGRFRADTSGGSDLSHAYEKHFYKGLSLPLPGPFWMDYVCSLDQPTGAGFKGCVCGGK